MSEDESEIFYSTKHLRVPEWDPKTKTYKRLSSRDEENQLIQDTKPKKPTRLSKVSNQFYNKKLSRYSTETSKLLPKQRSVEDVDETTNEKDYSQMNLLRIPIERRNTAYQQTFKDSKYLPVNRYQGQSIYQKKFSDRTIVSDRNEFYSERKSTVKPQKLSSEDWEANLGSRRPSILLPELNDQERIFLDLVEEGNLDTVKQFLHENQDLNINCENFNGDNALHIAVRNSNEEMTEFLLEYPNIEIGDCHLYAIRLNEIRVLTMLLDKLEENEEFAPVQDSPEFPPNITPLILAAESGHFEIVGLLLKRGHYILRPHKPRCFCLEECQRSLTTQDPLNVTSGKFHTYSALANPAYICHSSDDPILRAFKLSRELLDAASVESIYMRRYEELAEKTRLFAADLIDMCRTSEEVQVLLSNERGSKSLKAGLTFPRLILAMDYKQIEFVAHANVQQILLTKWIGDWYKWLSYSELRKASHILPRIVLLPFIIFIISLGPLTKWSKFFSLPVNRMLNHVASYLIFLIFVYIKSNENNTKQNREITISGVEIPLFLYVISFIMNSIRLILLQGLRRYFKFQWNVYEVVMENMFVMSFLMWTIAFINYQADKEEAVKETSERKYWHYLDPKLISEAFFLIATIMAFLKILLICQINYDIGPLQVSLGKMTNDCAKFSVIFIVILLAFTAGLCKYYSYYEGMVLKNANTGEELKQEDSFTSNLNTFKILFWGIFGMTSFENADVIIANFNDTNVVNEHHLTEAVGYITFAVYMILMVIILLNMLIATMSNTYQRVTDNVDTEWVFGRTEVFLMYIDQTILPPPFNILTMILGFTICAGPFSVLFKKCCQQDIERGKFLEEKKDEYQILMAQLVQRYFSKTGSA